MMWPADVSRVERAVRGGSTAGATGIEQFLSVKRHTPARRSVRQPAKRYTDRAVLADCRSGTAPTLARMRVARRDVVAVSVAVALLVAAFVIPHLHLGIVTPLINAT